MRRQHGFTMIELLIVVAILGIIAAIAVPSYSSYMMQSRRTEAVVLMTEVAGEQVRWFSENNQYADKMTTLGYGADNEPTENGHYLVSVAGTASTFTVTATPQGKQAGDAECLNFTLDSVGVKAVTGSSSANPENCW